jgi:hypothetical protein
VSHAIDGYQRVIRGQRTCALVGKALIAPRNVTEQARRNDKIEVQLRRSPIAHLESSA